MLKQDVKTKVNEGDTVDLSFFEYFKSFDVVCHIILLQKLLELGTNGAIGSGFYWGTYNVRWVGQLL